jgi:glucose-1-phosphate thymidylyltransferase
MICIVIAAGYATRMGELTKNFPKPLLKVEGRHGFKLAAGGY